MVILAVGLNLLFGYTGQISLAHATFYAIGAYATSLLEVHAGLSFWVTMPIAIIFAVIVAIFIGIPTLKLKDHYLALANPCAVPGDDAFPAQCQVAHERG